MCQKDWGVIKMIDENWLGSEKKESGDPPFRIDKINYRVICNLKSTVIQDVLKHSHGKIKDMKMIRSIHKGVVLAMAVSYVMDYSKEIDKSGKLQSVIVNKYIKSNKEILLHILKVIPERKEKHKVVAKDRYESRGGRELAQRNAHQRLKNADPEGYFHWRCPDCEPTEHYSAVAYKQHQGQWRSLIIAIKKHPQLKDYLINECGDFEDYNIQKLYSAYRNSQYCKVKSRATKSPKTGQSISKHVIENMKIKLKDEGHALPKCDVDDDKAIMLIHQFRLATSQADLQNKNIEVNGFKIVSAMNGASPGSWSIYRDIVYNFCFDKELDYDSIIRPRERRSRSDTHERHS